MKPGSSASDEMERALDAKLDAKLNNLRSWVVGTAVVFFVLLVGVISGMTYGMVMLIPAKVNTSVTPSTAGSVLLFNPRGGASLSGEAMLDLTGGFLNQSHTTLFMTDGEGAIPRRSRALLQSTGNVTGSVFQNNSDVYTEIIEALYPQLDYIASIPASVILDACNFFNNGITSFTAKDTTGGDGTSVTYVMFNIIVKSVMGCNNATNNLNGVWATATLNDWNIEVHCDPWLCAAFNATTVTANTTADVSTVAAPRPPPAPNATNATNTIGRRLLIASCSNICSSTTKDCLDCCNNIGWVNGCPSRAPSCGQYSGCDRCDGQATLYAKTATIVAIACVSELVSGGIGFTIATESASAYIADYPNCCWVCQGGYQTDNKCGCKAKPSSGSSCFPGEATVQVEGRGSVRMDELAYGDRVLVAPRGGPRAGAPAYRPVYLFGHRDASSVQTYVSLRTASGHTLRLSPSHYIPVLAPAAAAKAGGSAELGATRPKYASEVRPGDVVLVSTPGNISVVASEVLSAWLAPATGAFNPFVRGADLVVDGVVASPHSDWVLDGVTPAALRHHLPAVYEALLAPVYAAYLAVGARAAEWLAHGGLGLAEACGTDSAGLLGYAGFVVGAAALPAAGLAAAVTVLPASFLPRSGGLFRRSLAV